MGKRRNNNTTSTQQPSSGSNRGDSALLVTLRELANLDRQHSELLKKTKNQAKEIAILNKRLSEAKQKLHIINEADRVKYELAPYAGDRSFRQVVTDPKLTEQVERVLKAPHTECLSIYDNLINRRNMLTHPYTSRNWGKQSISL